MIFISSDFFRQVSIGYFLNHHLTGVLYKEKYTLNIRFTFTAVLQQPALDGELVALAGQGLAVSNNVVVDATQTSAAPGARWQTAEEALAETLGLLTDGDARLDQSGRSPVQFATAAGDLELRGSAGLVSARPLRLAAGEDLRLSGTDRRPAAA